MALFWPGGQGQGDSADDSDLGSYDSNHLLDSILDELNLPNDAALAEALEVDASVISDLRGMRREVDAAMLIRMHELTDISIVGLRNILGDRRRRSRFSEGGGEQPVPVPEKDNAMNHTTQKENMPPAAPASGKPAPQDQAPREIPREELDHKQPADADPDDPVSP